MGFFFGDGELESNKVKKNNIPLHTARELGCRICPLAKEPNLNPDMAPDGTREPILYALAEAPGAVEDKEGKPLIGPSGQLFRSHFPNEWKDLIRYNNCVRTRPPLNRDPTELELACCRNSIEDDIEKTKPLVVIGVGKIALNWLIGNSELSKWRGRFVPIQIKSHKCWMYPIYHPSFILRQQKKSKSGKVLKSQWDYLFEHDIDRLLRTVESGELDKVTYIPKDDYYKGLQWTEGLKSDRELQRVLDWLESLMDEPIIGVDIETNNLRPYYTDARILTFAFGTFDKTYSFPFEYKNAWNPEQFSILKKALRNFIIRSGVKVAHNLKFEQEWIAVNFGEDVLRKTQWDDTMAQAYVLDERKGMLDLGTLVRVNCGFWLKELSNLNREKMESYSLKEILPYNGLDVKWMMALHEKQQQRLNKDQRLESVHQQLIRTSATLTLAQKEGICVNEQTRLELDKDLTQKIKMIEHQINELDEVNQFKKQTGMEYNSSSHKHNIIIFTEILDYAEQLATEQGGISADESKLTELTDCKLANLILELRGLTKKKSTYIDPIPHLLFPDNKIHTNFNTYATRTGRLSSNSPNLQNQPKRKGKEIRRQFIPPKNHVLVAGDYGQIEARLIAVASQDEVFMEAIWNDYDIHMEWAHKIAKAYPKVVGGARKINNKEIMKTFRGEVKNKWTFPAFYGASIYSIAGYLNLPVNITFDLFEEFWDTFKGVKKWQDWIVNRANEIGYAETLTGRRRHLPMTPNELINSSIQGTASDICVDAMNRLSEAGIRVALNIHDDVTAVTLIDDLEEHIETHAKIMCEVDYPWLNIPIAVEMSIGNNWCDLEEVAVFKSTDYIEVPKKKFNGFDFYLKV